jgi:hypothetical protein
MEHPALFDVVPDTRHGHLGEKIIRYAGEIPAMPKSRTDDLSTSKMAADFVKAKATTARVRLMQAHAANPQGLTDEEAASWAGISLGSEYATRCSELVRAGLLEDTDDTRIGASGAARVVRRITEMGVTKMLERGRS